MKRKNKLIIILCLVFLGLSKEIFTSVYFQFTSSSSTGIIQPDIILEQGTSGTSVIYSNGTSASVHVDSYSTTFYPKDDNTTFGQYISGLTPGSISTSIPVGTGETIQLLGRAISETSLTFDPVNPIVRS